MPMHRFLMHGYANPNPLYYEDFDLKFVDNDKNGTDDAYEGSPLLKVWVANIRASVKADDDDLPGLRRFFAKTHDYYTGKTVPEFRANILSGPDWPEGRRWFAKCGGARLFKGAPVDVLEGEACTHHAAIKSFRKHSYTLTYLLVHSDETGHAFEGGDLTAEHIAEMKTGSLITINHGCFSANWTKNDDEESGRNTAQSWVFGKHLGQAVIAQVRSGGISQEGMIYARLRDGDYLGKAYFPCKQANEIQASVGDHKPGDIVSGVLLIGNPFLGITPATIMKTRGQSSLIIRKAIFGELSTRSVFDVTRAVTALIEDDGLWVDATCENFGDPAHGIAKKLKVDYTVAGIERTLTVEEGETLMIEVDASAAESQ